MSIESFKELLGCQPYIFGPVDAGSPMIPGEKFRRELRLCFMEMELERMQGQLQEAWAGRNLEYALYLSRCIAHLKCRIRCEKGEPLFDKPTGRKIKNQRRGSK